MARDLKDALTLAAYADGEVVVGVPLQVKNFPTDTQWQVFACLGDILFDESRLQSLLSFMEIDDA